MHLKFKFVERSFQYPFTTNKGTKTHQQVLLLCLEHLGMQGFGESPCIPYYSGANEIDLRADLGTYKTAIEKFALSSPERFWHFLHHLIPNNSFLINALDMAAWDWYGKINRKSLSQCLQLPDTQVLQSNYTIGADSKEKMLEKMQAHPCPVYKIKVVSEADITTLEWLRQHLSSSFRIDANEAWTLQEFTHILPALAKLNIECIEQPLHRNDQEGLKQIKQNQSISIPIVADESCVGEKDVAACHGYFDAINIKLTKCGGLTPALRMIKQARHLDMKIMLGNMCEGHIGTAALAHIASLADWLDLDGPLLAQDQIAKGLTIEEEGKIRLSSSYGLGITMPNDFF